jgi:hypothetical protein
MLGKNDLKYLGVSFNELALILFLDGKYTFQFKNIADLKAHLTKRALDGAKAPRKSKRSTGSPRK